MTDHTVPLPALACLTSCLHQGVQPTGIFREILGKRSALEKRKSLNCCLLSIVLHHVAPRSEGSTHLGRTINELHVHEKFHLSGMAIVAVSKKATVACKIIHRVLLVGQRRRRRRETL